MLPGSIGTAQPCGPDVSGATRRRHHAPRSRRAGLGAQASLRLLALLALLTAGCSRATAGAPDGGASGTGEPTGVLTGTTTAGTTATGAPGAGREPSQSAGIVAVSLRELFGAQSAFAEGALPYTPADVAPTMAETAGSPGEAANLDLVLRALGTELDPTQRRFLQDNGFLLLDLPVDASGFCFGPGLLYDGESCGARLRPAPDEMVAMFEQFGGSSVDLLRNPANSVYVSADVILHTHHVFIDRYFKRLESRVLYPRLAGIVERLQSAAFDAGAAATTPDAKASLQRVAAYLTLGRVLLETRAAEPPPFFRSPDEQSAWRAQDDEADATVAGFQERLAAFRDRFDADTYEAIRSELPRILSADAVTFSPLFAGYDPLKPVDYTQFTPRSHYRETSRLRAYFRTMMLFGRQTFPFASPEGLQDAAILAALIAQSGVESDWAALSDTTDFFAGRADDICYDRFGPALGDVLDDSPDELVAEEAMERVRAAAYAMPAPRILSDVVIDFNIADVTKEDLLLRTKGFRLFGQKFTFDAWVLNRMTAGQEKTEVQLPSTPTTLFVASALGSDVADEQVAEWVSRTGRRDLDAGALRLRLAGIRGEIDAVRPEEWLTSIGGAWLWTLQPLLQAYGQGYPAFMQGEPYRRKSLQTALGAYTELKHDTLLYAKQSYAELGGGGPDLSATTPPPVPRGFVEPDLEFWARVIAMTQVMRDGLAARGLLEDDVAGRFVGYVEALLFYRDLARKELTNEPIRDDEYEELRTGFWKVSELIAPFANEEIPPEDQRSPLIADVHTDALEGRILYQATGRPLVMLAHVADQGSARIVVGVAYRHFELTGDLGARLTDQDWRARIDSGDLPETPFWYAPLFVK